MLKLPRILLYKLNYVLVILYLVLDPMATALPYIYLKCVYICFWSISSVIHGPAVRFVTRGYSRHVNAFRSKYSKHPSVYLCLMSSRTGKSFLWYWNVLGNRTIDFLQRFQLAMKRVLWLYYLTLLCFASKARWPHTLCAKAWTAAFNQTYNCNLRQPVHCKQFVFSDRVNSCKTGCYSQPRSPSRFSAIYFAHCFYVVISL